MFYNIDFILVTMKYIQHTKVKLITLRQQIFKMNFIQFNFRAQ